MQTVIEVTIDWAEDADSCLLGQEELENAIHETLYECADQTCNITTNIKRWE